MNNNSKFDTLLEKINKFDILFDTLFKKIETIEQKIETIDQKINSMDEKINSMDEKINKLEKEVKLLVDYRKRDDKIIENEIKISILNNLKIRNQSLLFFDASHIYPKILKNEKGEKIAELDGLIIGTNDRVFASKYCDEFEILKSDKTISENRTEKIYNMYIVEAKHNITKEKIIYKYEQLSKVKEYFKKIFEKYKKMKEIQTNKSKKSLYKYEKIILNYDLHFFSEDNIHLIIGGPSWQQDALNYYKKNLRDKKNIYKIELSGNRYNFILNE